MSKKKYNYIDETVKIDFSYPSYFQQFIDDMEKYDAADNYAQYNAVCEPFVYAICKNYYAEGILTKTQWETFQRRYLL